MLSEQKPTLTHEESMETLKKATNLLRHLNEHVCEIPVKFLKWDPDCETCQIIFDRIAKKSEGKPAVALGGKALAHVLMTTVLCYRGIHKECAKYYVRTGDMISIECLCECHNEVAPRKKRRRDKN